MKKNVLLWNKESWGAKTNPHNISPNQYNVVFLYTQWYPWNIQNLSTFKKSLPIDHVTKIYSKYYSLMGNSFLHNERVTKFLWIFLLLYRKYFSEKKPNRSLVIRLIFHCFVKFHTRNITKVKVRVFTENGFGRKLEVRRKRRDMQLFISTVSYYFLYEYLQII